MPNTCKECGDKDNYNFALDVGLCNPCVGEKLEELDTAKEENQSFGNVLAVIHRDGGHYITRYGHEQASKAAIKLVLDLRDKLDAHRWIPVEERLPEKGDHIIVLWNSARLRRWPTVLRVNDTWPDPDNYTHWMIMPELPEGE